MKITLKFEAAKGPFEPFAIRYPFAQMDVGDAMWLAKGVPLANVKSAAAQWGKKHGRKFEHRTDRDLDLIVRIA